MRNLLALRSHCDRLLTRVIPLISMLLIGIDAHAQPTDAPAPHGEFNSFLESIHLDRLDRSEGEPQELFKSWLNEPIALERELVEQDAVSDSERRPIMPPAGRRAVLSTWLRRYTTRTTAASIHTADVWSSAGRHVCDGETLDYSQSGCGCRCDRWHLFNDTWGFQIGGWFQGGVLFNTDGRFNSPVLFNDRANKPLLNQLNLVIEKPVGGDGNRWDFGGRVDVMYGTDSRFLAVPGLENHQDDTPKWNSESGRYGLAIPQAYIEIAAPVHQALSLKVGHFYAITGFESFPTPYNYFYSVPYALAYGLPFTHTGALMTYRPSDQVIMQLGYTTGWDTWSSLADTYGILGQFFFTSSDRRTAWSATAIVGQDETGVTAGTPLSNDRVLVDLVMRHRITDRLKCAVQTDIGYQKDGEVIVAPGPSLIGFDSASWGGITSYLIYDHSPVLSSALRLEWFQDSDQSRLGIPVTFDPGGPTFNGGNYFAMTAGVNWRPNTNITVRPELRFDFSDLEGSSAVPGGDPTIRAFDSRSDFNQVTLGGDLIVFF
jgi:hypothetical protein